MSSLEFYSILPFSFTTTSLSSSKIHHVKIRGSDPAVAWRELHGLPDLGMFDADKVIEAAFHRVPGVPHHDILPSRGHGCHGRACSHFQIHVRRCIQVDSLRVSSDIDGIQVIQLLLRVLRIPTLVEVSNALQTRDTRLARFKDFKVGMQAGGEGEGLRVRVDDPELGLEDTAVEDNEEMSAKLMGPDCESGRGRFKGEFQNSIQVVGIRIRRGSGHGPIHAAGEAVLREGTWSELGETNWHATGNRFTAIKDSIRAEVQDLVATWLLP
mmetsp:Transcript_19403/g.35036  ORF Transcript_19403/g.35036 Transcript_19403/m.35036 type:complete len:269 (+) Transcript_19403:171-977(+)